MAQDIVEKMRTCENDPMWADHAEIPKAWCKAAADEIERLRAEAEHSRRRYDRSLCDAWNADDAARQEIARLRAAVTQLANTLRDYQPDDSYISTILAELGP